MCLHVNSDIFSSRIYIAAATPLIDFNKLNKLHKHHHLIINSKTCDKIMAHTFSHENLLKFFFFGFLKNIKQTFDWVLPV